ncbi:MAG TPA: hypothetical protein VFJ14_17620 [Nocardioidaceae bacterium]|nr:hypothetical protein [Nocardioidaceae bacterium]
MKKQTVGAIAVAATLGATTLAWSSPASAELNTRCVGEAGAVTVPGDLVVPRGEVCILTGTTVQGDVRVARNADLLADGATIGGRVAANNNAYFEAVGSTVDGEVVLNGAYGSYLESSDLGARVLTRPNAITDTGGFVYTFQSSVSGSLVSRSAELFVEASEIGGTVNSRNSLYADLYESFVDGRVLVRNNERGGVVCASAVQGDSRFVGNGVVVQLGSDGPFADCADGSYWGGDVTANRNTGGVFVDNNIVNGDLTLRNNDPVAQVGDDNMIRGEIVGQYEDWDAAAPMTLQHRSVAPQSNPQRRDNILDQKIEQRHAGAVKSAARAGAAHIGR